MFLPDFCMICRKGFSFIEVIYLYVLCQECEVYFLVHIASIPGLAGEKNVVEESSVSHMVQP